MNLIKKLKCNYQFVHFKICMYTYTTKQQIDIQMVGGEEIDSSSKVKRIIISGHFDENNR